VNIHRLSKREQNNNLELKPAPQSGRVQRQRLVVVVATTATSVVLAAATGSSTTVEVETITRDGKDNVEYGLRGGEGDVVSTRKHGSIEIKNGNTIH